MKTNFNNIVTRLNRKQGFSLVELMIVVAIIGILAALAIPRFQQFQAKSKQAEARSNLAHIYTLQLSYNGDNDTFSNFTHLTLGGTAGGTGGYAVGPSPDAAVWADVNTCNTTNDIGFRVTDCKKVRYAYDNIGNQNQFTATAAELDAGGSTTRRVFPGCSTGMNDTWQIDENKQMYNLVSASSQNALQGCNN